MEGPKCCLFTKQKFIGRCGSVQHLDTDVYLTRVDHGIAFHVVKKGNFMAKYDNNNNNNKKHLEK